MRFRWRGCSIIGSNAEKLFAKTTQLMPPVGMLSLPKVVDWANAMKCRTRHASFTSLWDVIRQNNTYATGTRAACRAIRRVVAATLLTWEKSFLEHPALAFRFTNCARLNFPVPSPSLSAETCRSSSQGLGNKHGEKSRLRMFLSLQLTSSVRVLVLWGSMALFWSFLQVCWESSSNIKFTRIQSLLTIKVNYL